jgi:hypothetical protein
VAEDRGVEEELKNYSYVAPTSCQWYAIVKNGKFQVLNNGKPVVGELVGKPELIAKYGPPGSGGSTTATTAAG